MDLIEEKFNPWNVRDELKPFSLDDIRQWQSQHRRPFHIAMFNDTRDFNFASMVRNAASFGASGVHLIADTKKWDRRGAVGAQHYVDLFYHDTIDEFMFYVEKYLSHLMIIGVENNTETSIPTLYYPNFPDNIEDSVLVFGAEGSGLPLSFLERCDYQIEIPTPGCMRSLNVAVASGILMAHLALAQTSTEVTHAR